MNQFRSVVSLNPDGADVSRMLYQCPQPALLTVDMPALDGRERGGVSVLHGDANSELQYRWLPLEGALPWNQFLMYHNTVVVL